MKTSNNGGQIIIGQLGIAFVVLKLCDVIDWSWWWVVSPFWITLALFLVTFFLAFFGWFAIQAIKRSNHR